MTGASLHPRRRIAGPRAPEGGGTARSPEARVADWCPPGRANAAAKGLVEWDFRLEISGPARCFLVLTGGRLQRR